MSEALTVTRRQFGMITLRGDLADPRFSAAITDATGADAPGVRRIAFGRDGAAAWMSPDEVTLFVPEGAAAARLAVVAQSLAGTHHLVADMSDARAVFRIDGPGARDALAKGAPVDLSPEAFGPGDFRRSRLGQVAAALWMTPGGTLELMCFRSVADFVETWLHNATRPGAAPAFHRDR